MDVVDDLRKRLLADMKRSEAPSKKPNWKENRRTISVWIHKDQHRALNTLRANEGKSVRRLVEEAVNELLKAKGMTPVDIGDADTFGD